MLLQMQAFLSHVLVFLAPGQQRVAHALHAVVSAQYSGLLDARLQCPAAQLCRIGRPAALREECERAIACRMCESQQMKSLEELARTEPAGSVLPHSCAA